MNIFIASDHHFGHHKILTFMGADGRPCRPWSNVDDMHQAIIYNHNQVVGPRDKVYFLGDLCWNKKYLPLLSELNGDKVLIKGNHDIFELKEYEKYFRDVRAYHVMDKMLLSHMPIHPGSMDRYRMNIHGHLHEKSVGDNRYFCVSLEQINYTPIEFEECRLRAKMLDEEYGVTHK